MGIVPHIPRCSARSTHRPQQRRRGRRAALRLMRKLLRKRDFAPQLLVTDKLRFHAFAFWQFSW
jgi:hypothetical protein